MRTYKDIGITFKQKNINEADMIVSILTKYHGRVDAVVKGIRKIKSRKTGNMDLMTLSKFAFAKGKNLDVITEVELIDQYQDLKNKLSKTFNIFYICELMDSFTKSGIEERNIYYALIELLNTLRKSDNSLPLRAFELFLLREAGFNPNLDSCVFCNKPLKLKSKKYVIYNPPGFYCTCKENIRGKEINDREIKVFRFINRHKISSSASIKSNKKLESKMFYITVNWLQNMIEKELKSKKYL